MTTELNIDPEFFDTQIRLNELSESNRVMKSTCTHNWILISKNTKSHFVCTECLKDKND